MKGDDNLTMKNLQDITLSTFYAQTQGISLASQWVEGSTHERREWTSEEPDDNNWVLTTIYV